MARLIYFIAFIIALLVVMNFSKYQGIKPNNSKFNFKKTAAFNKKRAEEVDQLLNPKTNEKENVVVVEGPLVELSTPQLQNGSDLYKKCVVCHGKRGQGKLAQKAPAIGGQYDWYIELQVMNMKNGKRVNKIMNPYIKKLSADDVKDLAAYISKLPHMGKKK